MQLYKGEINHEIIFDYCVLYNAFVAIFVKAEFIEVDIFFLLQLFARDILSMKSWKLKKLRPPSIQLLKLI